MIDKGIDRIWSVITLILGIYRFIPTYLYYLHNYKSERLQFKIYPLRGYPTQPTCTRTWCAGGGAGEPEFTPKYENILQHWTTDQLFPVHHQWCSQENSWNKNSEIFLEELIKISKNNLEEWKRVYIERGNSINLPFTQTETSLTWICEVK